MTMLLEKGAKILASHRRLFEGDTARFFVGEVLEYQDGLVKVSGYSWTRDVASGFHRKSDPRKKIISLSAGTVLVYELPKSVSVSEATIEQSGTHEVVLRDKNGVVMDLSERIVPNT